MIYEWTGGKISLSDRELATVIVLAASVSAFAAFALMKGLEGIAMALGYMWETVVAKRRRLAEEAEQEKAAIRKQARDEGLAKGRAEMQEENARLKARIAELEQNRNSNGE